MGTRALSLPVVLLVSQAERWRVDGLELAAVDHNARCAEQHKASAQHYELAANPADGLAVVLPEVGCRLSPAPGVRSAKPV
jgi:hypothetical protein